MYITLEDAKQHLNVTTDSDDDLITAKIQAATDWIGQWIAPIAEGDPIPGPIQEACRKLVADFYESREASTDQASRETQFGVFWLIMPYRDWSF